jgi:hypothetical protein
MPVAKIEPPPKSDIGSKIVPWEKRHADGKDLRRVVPSGVACRVVAIEGPARPTETHC